jgi:hypothetical protein
MANEAKKSADLVAKEAMVDEGKKAPAIVLKDDVAKLYEPADGAVRVFLDTKSGRTFDLNKVTMKDAEGLVAIGVLAKKVS